MTKIIKDPIYGYISLPEKLVNDVIDRPEFQRLRRVSQTSFSPVYPSSSHNRFVHSLGVYHLGCLASDTLFSCLKHNHSSCYKDNKEKFDRLFEVFKYACLLHDVGHAPFSHTLERFFSNSEGIFGAKALNSDLCSIVGEQSFYQDVAKLTDKGLAKPHEVMSAIIGIESFDILTDGLEKAFFARCITGYKHNDLSSPQNQIENILIGVLNSSVFDVDKIDYLIRDAYTSGYQSVSIDYHRFFSSLRIALKDGVFVLALHKGAINVLENLVYAHDFERKWVQSHPMIIYKSYLLESILSELMRSLKDNEKNVLFSKNSLSREGIDCLDRHIMLLSDDDVISLLKSKKPEVYLDLCDRSNGKKSLWKSEGEYRAYFDAVIGQDGGIHKRITKALSDLVSMTASYLIPINGDAIGKLTKKLEESKSIEDDFIEDFVNNFNDDTLLILKGFKQFSKECGIDFDFDLVSSKRFKSNFTKEDLAKMLVCFDSKAEDLYELKSVSSIFKQDQSEQDFFYVFYKRNNGKTLSPKKLFKNWFKLFYK